MAKLRAVLMSVVVIGVVVGCGAGGSQTPVDLSGTVTYKGEPLKGGYMAFHTDNHGIINTTIRSGGKYEIKLPADTMRVTIETESFNPNKAAAPTYGPETAGGSRAVRGAPPGGEMKGKAERMQAEGKGGGPAAGGFGPAPKEELEKLYTKIPQKYAYKETSGFSLQLQPGKQTKDFELTD